MHRVHVILLCVPFLVFLVIKDVNSQRYHTAGLHFAQRYHTQDASNKTMSDDESAKIFLPELIMMKLQEVAESCTEIESTNLFLYGFITVICFLVIGVASYA